MPRAASMLIISIYGCSKRWSSAMSLRRSASCGRTSAKENRTCFQIWSKGWRSENYVQQQRLKKVKTKHKERKRNGRRSSDKKRLGGNTRRNVPRGSCHRQRENRRDRR